MLGCLSFSQPGRITWEGDGNGSVAIIPREVHYCGYGNSRNKDQYNPGQTTARPTTLFSRQTGAVMTSFNV